MQSEIPYYDEKSKIHRLHYNTNKKYKKSNKNFCIVDNEDKIIMEFGKTKSHSFSITIDSILNIIQSFGISISYFWSLRSNSL